MGQFFFEMILIPICYYAVWAVFYSTINFVVAAKRIRERHRASLYIDMSQSKGLVKVLK